MSATDGVRAALRFIAAARSDPALRERLKGVETGSGLAPVLAIASELGFSFSEDELRAAHRHDWGLRRMRYIQQSRPSDGAAGVSRS